MRNKNLLSQTVLPIALTILLLVALEYTVQVPSRFFVTEQKKTVDTDKDDAMEVNTGKIDDSQTSTGGDEIIRADDKDDTKKDGEDEDTMPSNQGICTREYMPVCGKDNKTYSNGCTARSEGVEIAYTGACHGYSNDDQDVSETPASWDTASSASLANEGLASFSTGSYHIYKNEWLKYGVALPKYTYYQGFGSQDGATHTLGVALTSSGLESFWTAEVRVYFYNNKLLPELKNESKYEDQATGKTYVNLSGSTLVIEWDRSVPKVANIMDTILQSAEKQ